MSMTPLIDNEHRFADAFTLFRRVSDQENKMKQWIQQKLSDVINSTHPLKVDDEVIQLMGIGSGFGQMDMLLFDVIGNKNKKINELVLEPNKVEIEKFKSAIKASAEYSCVSLECIPETVESYMKRKSTRKFHFIHCIHVLYYVKDPIATIEAAFNSLVEGGILFIIHSAASHGITHVKNKFGSKLAANQHNYVPNGNELEQLLDTRGYKYLADVIHSKLDVTECLYPDSHKGNLLWDFITHVDHFCERAPQELKDAIHDVIGSEFCYEENGRVYMRLDCSVLIVVK